MATARQSLFSREARGKLAGLSLSHRRSVGQVIRAIRIHPYTPSPKQLQNRQRLAWINWHWHLYYQAQSDRDPWDRLRRYERLPGTAYSRLMTSYLPLEADPAALRYMTRGFVDRSAFPGGLALGILVTSAVTYQVASYGPTPLYPSHLVVLSDWGGGRWVAVVTDHWPTQRVFARFAMCTAPGKVNGESALFATTQYG